MSKPHGFSIRIFLPDGTPDGLKLVEKSNWSGLGVVCPRSLFAEKKAQAEFARTGVYVLLGPSDTSELPRVYVGQGDAVRPRLEAPRQEGLLDDRHLLREQGRQPEQRPRALSGGGPGPPCQGSSPLRARQRRSAAAAVALGGRRGRRADLPRRDAALLPRARRERLREAGGLRAQEGPVLYLKAKDCDCRGYESADGFVVLKGSRARVHEVPSLHAYLTDLRATLVANGVLEQDGATYVLTQDYEFRSPSSASAAMEGRTSNGRVEWHDKDGRTLKEQQEFGAGPTADADQP